MPVNPTLRTTRLPGSKTSMSVSQCPSTSRALAHVYKHQASRGQSQACRLTRGISASRPPPPVSGTNEQEKVCWTCPTVAGPLIFGVGASGTDRRHLCPQLSTTGVTFYVDTLDLPGLIGMQMSSSGLSFSSMSSSSKSAVVQSTRFPFTIDLKDVTMVLLSFTLLMSFDTDQWHWSGHVQLR